MGVNVKELFSYTGRTGNTNSYSARLNIANFKHFTFFLRAAAPVTGTVIVTIKTTNDAVATTAANVTSYNLGTFTTVSAASKQILPRSVDSLTFGPGTMIWANAELLGTGGTTNQGTATFGLGVVLRE